jgi:hypothetical protein
MGSEAPPPDRRGVRNLLVAFAVLGVVGVLVLLVSVVLGLVLLIVAELFFAIAFRRFSRRTRQAG